MDIFALEPRLSTTRIPAGGIVRLDADIALPAAARGVVIFVHDAGSDRESPRNRFVATQLNDVDLATVVADLATDYLPLMVDRVIQVLDWTHHYNLISTLPIGVLGCGTGAAAALDAAAARPELVRAVVTRGGRLDLATRLQDVQAPTLLIAGGNDRAVLDINARAFRSLPSRSELKVVPGASHRFDEPAALEAVATAAGGWFTQFLTRERKR